MGSNHGKAHELRRRTTALSSFFDGELSGSALAEVHAHVQTCPDCQAELVVFEKLSESLGEPPPGAAPPWSAIQTMLSDVSPAVTLARPEASGGERKDQRSKWFQDAMVFAASVAASILILVWTMHRNNDSVQLVRHDGSFSENMAADPVQPHLQDSVVASHDHAGHQHGVHNGEVAAFVDLQDTLKLHASGTEAAAYQLASRYNGRTASPSEVVEHFGREPSIQSILPDSVQLVSTQLLEMPQCNCPEDQCTCGPGKCNCVAAVCQRPDGTTFLVVEQCRGQDVSFGDAPTKIVRRGNHELKVGTSGEAMAVSWKAASGRLTAFGLNSLDELEQMLAMN